MPSDPAQTEWGFPSTSWTLVRRTRADDADGGAAGEALDALCRAYWRPLYAYARGRGLARADAQDAVQDFFAVVLRRELFQRAEPDAGKLRSFLLTALKRHLLDRAAHENAARRRPEGGWAELDFEATEAEWGRGVATIPEAEAGFERQWARELLARATERLAARYAAEGKREVFDALRSEALEAESGEGDSMIENRRTAATPAGMSSGARRVAVHRLRRRFADALRATVAETLPEGGDVDAELRELGAALAKGRA